LLAELFLTHNISANQYIGALIKHHPSQGGIKEAVLDDYFYDTSIDLTYSTFEEAYNWTADIGYQNQVYNWYGLPIDYVTFTEDQIKSIDEKKGYNSFNMCVKLYMIEC